MTPASPIIDEISRRLGNITRIWLEAVWSSDKFESAQQTPTPQLLDHIPALLEDLTSFLRMGGDHETEEHARIHGTHRWHQQFALHEVLRELLLLRRIIIQQVESIHDCQGADDQSTLRELSRRIGRFFDEVLIFSASQFSEQQQKQIEADAKLISAEHDSIKADLQAVDSARLRLLRVISHELRNLLNGASLTVESLFLEEDPEWIARLREILKNSHNQMTGLVNQLLDVAPLLAGHEPLKLTTLNLKSFLQAQQGFFGGMAAAKKLSFGCVLDDSMAFVITDEPKLQRIVTNLVQNALKYTDVGSITLRCEPVDDRFWNLIVSDTGPGIPKEHAEKIFEEFHRVPGTENLPGTGLGLSIVKQLVEVLKGTIFVQPSSQRGATFVVTMPKEV